MKQRTVAVIGGGQLARMIALKAPPLGLKFLVFSASPTDPAAAVSGNWFQGRPEETGKLNRFLSQADILTFESELIPTSLIRKALPEGRNLRIAPSLDILGKLQDRLSQKTLLQAHNIPTAEFEAVSLDLPAAGASRAADSRAALASAGSQGAPSPDEEGKRPEDSLLSAFPSGGADGASLPYQTKRPFSPHSAPERNRTGSARLKSNGRSDSLSSGPPKNANSVLTWIWDRFGPFVLKTREGGYDGYGTFPFQKKSDLRRALPASETSRVLKAPVKKPPAEKSLDPGAKPGPGGVWSASAALTGDSAGFKGATGRSGAVQTSTKSLPSGGRFIAEPFLPFQRELAISAARNGKETVFTPLVETFQENSRCLWVRGPVFHKEESGLKRKIVQFLDAVNYRGLIAFELFDMGDRLLVNETAPRVHNSGHYSLNGLSEDQFTLHLKAILGFPLQTPKAFCGFAMLNLLGGRRDKQKPGLKQFHFHWYGKEDIRPGRKMGHVTALAESPEKALEKLIGKNIGSRRFKGRVSDQF